MTELTAMSYKTYNNVSERQDILNSVLDNSLGV